VAVYSLCKDSVLGGLLVVAILITLGKGLWSQWREDARKRAEEEATKPKSLRGEKAKLPVTIVTGFLGAGKTTLVNHILHHQKEYKILVIENEVGQEGIDNKLLVDIKTEDIILMNNGCICCKVRSDLLQVLKALLEKPESQVLDAVVIETTGVADPAPVIQTFIMDDSLKENMELDSVLCVVDAKHVMEHLDGEGDGSGKKETVNQIAFADRILVNKMDLVSEETMKEISVRLKAINDEARTIFCQRAEVNVGDLLGLNTFDAERATEQIRNLPVRQQMTVAGIHAHGGIGTVSVVVKGEMDLTKLNRWLGSLLQERGSDLFRMKGIMAIHERPEMFIFHGVHMIFQGQPGPLWKPEEERASRIVFIGKNLDRGSLERGFKSCCVQGLSLHDVE